MNIALVVPHFFMNKDILDKVIFSPGELAITLVDNLQKLGANVTLYSPNYIHPNPKVKNINCNLEEFYSELKMRSYDFLTLFKKHPLTFTTLARQEQTELIAKAIENANSGKHDLIHFFSNEEELSMVMQRFANVPCMFTHHDPYNFLFRYRNLMHKYKHLNWISISQSQQHTAPIGTNFIGNVYHGLDKDKYDYDVGKKNKNYFLYLGRITEAKGVDIAINACKLAKKQLKIVGKHYGSKSKNKYWDEIINPQIDGKKIQYLGFINDHNIKNKLIKNAKALIVPSIWEEPFGVVLIEALACGTPILGLNNGALPEIIQDGKNGFLVDSVRNSGGIIDKNETEKKLAEAIKQVHKIDRKLCIDSFIKKFTSDRMARGYMELYKKFI